MPPQDNRRALNDLTDTDGDAADVLLQMDDAATQWRFTRAYDSDSVDGDELATALKRYDELDANEKVVAQRAMARSDTDAVRLMRTDVCNSPCDGVLESVEDFTDGRSGLDDDASEKLVRAFKDSDDVPDGVPGEEPGTVMEDLEYLDDQNVDRLDETVDGISGDQSGYTGLAGETRTARRVIENNDDANVEMETTVDPDNIADEDLPDGVTRDDLKDGPTDIDVNNRNGAAYESKNTYFDSDEYRDSFSSDDIADVALGGDVNSLRKKLNTIAASGQDEIVVVVRNKDVTFDAEVRESFPSDVKDVKSLTGLADTVESQFDGTEVTIKSFDELKS